MRAREVVSTRDEDAPVTGMDKFRTGQARRIAISCAGHVDAGGLIRADRT